MQNSTLPRATTVALFLLLAAVSGRRAFVQAFVQATELPVTETESPGKSVMNPAHERGNVEAGAATIHGRVTTVDGETYEGRLRFGSDEEALWINTFNGFKPENPWVDYVPEDHRPVRHRSVKLFGVKLFSSDEPLDLGRPLMVRFGDITRIESSLTEIRVTMKSGAVHVLDRFAADDFADGVQIRDEQRGLVDVGEWKIRSITFMSGPLRESGRTARSAAEVHPDRAPPVPLYGTVHTQTGAFTGFIQWDREASLGSDIFAGFDDRGEPRVPFADIHSIARRGSDRAEIILKSGRMFELSGSRHTGRGHRGIYISDPRYGRVLVSWDVVQRVVFTPGPDAPSYDKFPAGRPLTGRVITASGAILSGRLVFDLDESETVETLDAPVDGVDYSIPFGQIASIQPGRAGTDAGSIVRLRSGEALCLNSSGDLGELNAGLLVFPDGSTRPQYVSWADVERIDLDAPAN